MSLTARLPLLPIDRLVLSSYPLTARTRAELRPVRQLPNGAGCAPEDVASALGAAHRLLTNKGVDFRVTELGRLFGVQAAARAKYDRWVTAGQPMRGTSGFDPRTMKDAYVALPGYSFHNGHRAIDVHLAAAQYPDTPADQQLDKLWTDLTELGWSPVIKTPEESASEAWHFDYLGEWSATKTRIGYADTAMCAALDMGITGYGNDAARALQAQLHRAGYDCGKVDGAIGKRTEAALKAAGLPASTRDYARLFGLPSAASTLWKP